MYKIVLGIGVLVIVVFGGYFFLRGSGDGYSNSNATVALQPIEIPATVQTNSGDTNQNTNQTGQNPLNANQATQTTNQTTTNYMQATVHTNKGDITIEFLPSQAPNTVANFEKLVQSGFYDNTKFHRVIPKFMIQGGDPLTKDDSIKARWGTGGPGYQFDDEITSQNNNAIGTVAMANSGPNTNGSQFFINVADNNFLDTKHTVFAHVVSGLDIVKAISITETVPPNDVPKDPIIISSITLK